MNAIEQLLQSDLDGLLDRLSATTREGTIAGCRDLRPELLSSIEAAEARLSEIRQDLLRDYALWQGAIDECRDLWEVAELAAEESLATRRAA